jgi:hypothetical protein
MELFWRGLSFALAYYGTGRGAMGFGRLRLFLAVRPPLTFESLKICRARAYSLVWVTNPV